MNDILNGATDWLKGVTDLAKPVADVYTQVKNAGKQPAKSTMPTSQAQPAGNAMTYYLIAGGAVVVSLVLVVVLFAERGGKKG